MLLTLLLQDGEPISNIKNMPQGDAIGVVFLLLIFAALAGALKQAIGKEGK